MLFLVLLQNFDLFFKITSNIENISNHILEKKHTYEYHTYRYLNLKMLMFRKNKILISNKHFVMPYPEQVEVVSEVRKATVWNGLDVLYVIISLAVFVRLCVKR